MALFSLIGLLISAFAFFPRYYRKDSRIKRAVDKEESMTAEKLKRRQSNELRFAQR